MLEKRISLTLVDRDENRFYRQSWFNKKTAGFPASAGADNRP
jgi:hypothetical protein